MNKDRLYLESIRDCLERIAEYTDSGEAAFLASRLIQDGVIRNLEVIGEATKNLSEDLRAANPSIPWRQIAGMRDVLIHDYLKVNLGQVTLPALQSSGASSNWSLQDQIRVVLKHVEELDAFYAARTLLADNKASIGHKEAVYWAD